MANPLVTQIVMARVAAAIASAESLAGVEHQLVKGRLRELIIEHLLRPMLPTVFGAGTGVVVDSKGGSSGEIDIVVYNRDVLSPLLFSERDGIFPVEACLYAIEVKSSLDLSHIDDTVAKFRKLSELSRLPGANRFEPIGALLAFKDRIAKDPKDAILTHCNSVDVGMPPLIRVGLVAGRAYWFFSEETNSWRVFDADNDHNELVSFIGGFANSLVNNDWAPIRRGTFQKDTPLNAVGFGHYIIGENVSRVVARPSDSKPSPKSE